MPAFGFTRVYCGKAYEKIPKFEIIKLDLSHSILYYNEIIKEPYFSLFDYKPNISEGNQSSTAN